MEEGIQVCVLEMLTFHLKIDLMFQEYYQLMPSMSLQHMNPPRMVVLGGIVANTV